jgi:multisubunit Na+/H+ antiporter MnhB subunit
VAQGVVAGVVACLVYLGIGWATGSGPSWTVAVILGVALCLATIAIVRSKARAD